MIEHERLQRGADVIFVSRKGTKIPAKIMADLTNLPRNDNVVVVKLEGDPFPITVRADQILRKGIETVSTTKTKRPGIKDLRKQAEDAGVEGWQDMDRATLETAVASLNGSDAPKKTRKRAPKKDTAKTDTPKRRGRPPGSKNKTTTAKKTAAKAKVSAKATENGDTPFRTGSNMEKITKELLKGGKRSTMIKRLLKKIEFHPWRNDAKDLDPEVEMDRRMALTAHILKKDHGYTIEKEGRGIEGTMRVVPPTKRGRKTKK